MIIRIKKSALLILSTAALPASVSAYYAQVNNAHVDFIASNSDSASAVETTDNRSSLQHHASLWSTLEDALQQKSHLGYTAPKIMELFDEWVERFEKEYETVEEKSKRMLVWLENHGKKESGTILYIRQVIISIDVIFAYYTLIYIVC